MDIKGKNALVLGSVKGIGKGIGLALGKFGARLALTRNDWQENFEEMENDFKAINSDHEIYTIDLCDIGQIEDLTKKLEEKFGHIDIFINNIERGGWPVVHGEYIQEQWDLEMATTLRAKRWVFNAVFPLLKKSKEAVVINLSSIAGIVGRTGPAALVFNEAYSAANRGISSLTETWARMGAPNIRVNEIMLGIFETRHAQGTRGWNKVLTGDEKQSLIDHTLVKRTGTIDDIVKACLFIIKDAPYMTGSVIRLDGGYVLGGEKVPPIPEGIV